MALETCYQLYAYILIANERHHCLPKIVLKINNVLWSVFYYNKTGTPTSDNSFYGTPTIVLLSLPMLSQ